MLWLLALVVGARAVCVPYAGLANASAPPNVTCTHLQMLFDSADRLGETPRSQLLYYWGRLVFDDIGLDGVAAQWATHLQGASGVCSAATPALDASFLYGSDAATTAALRSYWRGQMRLTPYGELPRACPGVAKYAGPDASPAGMPCAGDPRAAETVQLLALQTLLVMEHNRVAARLFAWDDTRTDQDLFASARKIVVALVQKFTFEEWLPELLGSTHPVPRYKPPKAGGPGPTILREFQFAVAPLLAAMAADTILYSDQNQELYRSSLGAGLYDPAALHAILGGADGVCTVATGLLRDPVRAVGAQVPATLLAYDFPAGACACARNASVPLARDIFPNLTLGVLTQNAGLLTAVRAVYARDDAAIAAALDLYVALALEDHGPADDDILGPMARALVVAQLVERTRDADGGWYEAPGYGGLSRRERKMVARASLKTTLALNCAFLESMAGTGPFDLWPVSDVKVLQMSDSNLDTPNRNAVIGMLVVVSVIFALLLVVYLVVYLRGRRL